MKAQNRERKPMGIGVDVREYREEHDLSQVELGELWGLSDSAISRIESGDRTQFQPDTLLKLAAGLDIPVAEFLARVADERPKAKAKAG